MDAGPTVLAGLKDAGERSDDIDFILLSHLHGDHFGGIPFFILDAQFSKRLEPLVIAGPPSIQNRVREAMEVFFPGSSQVRQRFPIEFIELPAEAAVTVGNSRVTAFPVVHSCGAPAYALRVEFRGRIVTYSGDTEWTETLIAASAHVDLFICEAYFFRKKTKFHLDYETLAKQRSNLTCKRLVVTHMSDDMLARTDLDVERAVDGLIVPL